MGRTIVDVVKLLSTGEVAVRGVMMDTQVVDVDMAPTGQKGRNFGFIRTLRSMEVVLNRLTQL